MLTCYPPGHHCVSLDYHPFCGSLKVLLPLQNYCKWMFTTQSIGADTVKVKILKVIAAYTKHSTNIFF